MKKSTLLITIVIIAIIGISTWAFLPSSGEGPQGQLIPQDTVELPFTRAEGVTPFEFPRDLGAHPEYQTEWWYYTGNLTADTGEHFGYQLTFFRRALTPSDFSSGERESAWGTNQVYLAHFAMTNVADNAFYAAERFSRGAAGLAGALPAPDAPTADYRVWIENWYVEAIAPNRYRLFATEGDRTLSLELFDAKGPVFQGDRGYSQKGPEPGNASFYYSQTRLEATGTVKIGERSFDVAGTSWKDHEYSTSALSAGQVGWDWFSVQLDNDTELMFFHIRRSDGSIDPFSSGTVITPDGETRKLTRDDFTIDVTDTWRSPHTRAEYPAGWIVNIPGENIELEITPYISDQELRVSYAYWEGAVQIVGTIGETAVSGNGYVEMTGYAESMEGEF